MQSELCSAEIERDLEKETARYLEEQVSSLNSSMLLKENELVSLRKRYKLLNEGFMQSETLKEDLEGEVSKLTKAIREMEERVQTSEEMSKDRNDNIKAAANAENAKLENEMLILNATLEKERNLKTNLEDMFANVEKERNLLVEEVEELRSEHQKQLHEVNVLRDLLHNKNKQEQLQLLKEQQLQQQLEQKHQKQSKGVAELEGENKKLEAELYQQLEVLENFEVENKSLKEKRNEFEEISGRLKILGFDTFDHLVAEYSVVKEGKVELERKIIQLENEISSSRLSKEKVELYSGGKSLDVNCAKSSCVPRSEYLKLKFQLKYLTDEVKSLKQIPDPKLVKEKVVSSLTKQERRCRKHENRMAKKWLKTMKESVKVVEDDDLALTQSRNVLVENQRYQDSLRVDELQHELEMIKKEKESWVTAKRKLEEELIAWKRQLVGSQETQSSLLRELKSKLGKAETCLEGEIQRGRVKDQRIVFLEEQNQEVCVELEKSKEKIHVLQNEKDRSTEELEKMKKELFRSFGNVSIETVSKTLTTAKERCVEYVKIIETNKNNLLKLRQDLNSLQQVNTILREELDEARTQLEKKDVVISEKSLSDSIAEKRKFDQLQAVIQALECSKQNEAELLAIHEKEKQHLEKSHEEIMNLKSELQETRILLSEKEKECATTNRIMMELEATCEVYEGEFEKSARLAQNENFPETEEDRLSSDESHEDECSESGSDSTAENFREMQEALQERMAMKVKRLQSRLEETLTAVSACQKLNIDLQTRLHNAEKKNLETEEIDGGRTSDKEFLETILKKISEKEKEIQEILQGNSSDPRDERQKYTENNVDELLSPYKETIKQLKIDNSKYEVRLVEANERISKLEQKLAGYQDFPEENSNGAEMVESRAGLYEEKNGSDIVLVKNELNEISVDHIRELACSDTSAFENGSTAKASEGSLNEADEFPATNDNSKQELDCMNAKYVNLKAAFEGCLRRLKMLEGDDGVKEETAGSVSMVERSSSVTEEMVVPKFISPLQERRTQTADDSTGSTETGNVRNHQAMKGSSFSEISCAVTESDSDDFIGSDRMVIELTLTENDVDSLEFPGNYEDVLQERLDYENEFSALRAKIIELEKLNCTTTSEIHRIKQSSFMEITDLENRLRSLEMANNVLKTTMAEVELQKQSADERGNQLDVKYSEAKQEIERIKVSSSKQQETSENMIKDLQDKDNTLRRRIVQMDEEKDELRKQVEYLQSHLQHRSQETERVKIECYNQGENYKKLLNECEREKEAYRREKEGYDLKVSELKEHTCMLEEEVRESKEEASLGSKQFEILIQNQQRSTASILEEKDDLQSKVIEFQLKVTTLKEALCREKNKNNEESEIRLEERKTSEDTIRQQQEDIVILKKHIENLNSKKVCSELVVKKLEEEIGLLNEERSRCMEVLSDEEQRLDDTSVELKTMITGFKEKFLLEAVEKDSKITLIQNENQLLKVINERLESQVKSCVSELQRIKSLSFNEKQKMEANDKYLKETTMSMERLIAKHKEEINHLNLMKNDLETKCIYLHKELERVKVCSFEENQLENKIEKLTEALSSIEIKFEDLKKEKDRLVLKEAESEEIIWKLQEEVHRIKTCAFEERENMITKHESDMAFVEQSNRSFESQIAERDREIVSLKFAVGELKDVRNALKSDKILQQEEISALETNVESLQVKIETLQNDTNGYQDQILTLRKRLSELKEVSDSFETKALQQDEELSSVRQIVDGVQHDKKQLQAKIIERNEQVASLQLMVSSLEEKRTALESDMLQRSAGKTTTQNLLADLTKQNTLLNDNIVTCNSEAALLKVKVSELEEERDYFAASIAVKDKELADFRITVNDLKDENSDSKETKIKQSNEIFVLHKKIADLEGERVNFMERIGAKDGELSDFRISLKNLENEKSALKEVNAKQSKEISLLKTTVADIEKERNCLSNDIAKKDEEVSSVKLIIENLQFEKKNLEEQSIIQTNEASLLKSTLLELRKERDVLEKDLSEKDKELSAMKLTIDNLQIENNAQKEHGINREDEISQIQTIMLQLQNKNKSLLDDIAEKNEELASINVTIRELQNGKNASEERNTDLTNEMSLLKSTMLQIEGEKECKTNEISLKEEEMFLTKTTLQKLQDVNKVLEDAIAKRDCHISLQQASIDKLGNEKDCLVDDIARKDIELSVLKETVEKFQNKNKIIEDSNCNLAQEISTMKITSTEFEKENESLKDEIDRFIEEMFTCKEAIKILESQKNALDKDVVERNNEVLLLKESNLSKLQEEKQFFTNEISERDKELSACREIIEQLKAKKKTLESDVIELNSETLLLKGKVSEVEEEKECLKNDMRNKDEKLSVLDITVETQKNEKVALQDAINARGNEISSLESRCTQLQLDKESATNELLKKDEKLSVLRMDVEKLQEVNKGLEEAAKRQDDVIQSFEERLVHLQNENESFINAIAMKNDESSVLRRTVEQFEIERKAFEDGQTKCGDEIRLLESKVVQIDSEKESFSNKLSSKDEELLALQITVENLKIEKKAIEADQIKCGDELRSLESKFVQNENERESLVNIVVSKDKELSAFKTTVEKLQHENNALQEDISKSKSDRSVHDENAKRLEKEKQVLSDALVEKTDELSTLKIDFEKLQTERRSLDERLLGKDGESLILNDNISKLEKEKETLANNAVRQEEALSSYRIRVEQLENEAKSFEDGIIKRDEEISSLQSNIFNLQIEKKSRLDSIAAKDEQIAAVIASVEKLREEKNALQDKAIKERDEILSLRNDINQNADAKKFLEVDIHKRDEELLSLRKTLNSLEDENKLLENNNVELNEKLSHYTIKIERYLEEINLLKDEVQKVTIQKESVENIVEEIQEKTKCDEEDFDKLVAGYLQEIDSWKRRFGALEEEMDIFRNEMERLQYERQDFENIIKEMSVSEREKEETFQENIKLYHKDIDSWKLKVQGLESDVEILRKTMQELETECKNSKIELNRVNEEKERDNELHRHAVAKFQKERENSEKRWILEKEEEIKSLQLEWQIKLEVMESKFATKAKEMEEGTVKTQQLKDDLNQFKNVISKKNEEVLNLKSQVVEFEKATLEANNKLHGFQQEYDRKENELKLSRNRVEELQAKSEKLTEIVSEKQERIFILENEIKGLSESFKEMNESKLEESKKCEDKLAILRDSYEAKDTEAKNELNLMEKEVNRLRNELYAIQQEKLEDGKLEKTVEKRREQLRILLADIDETTKIKRSLEKETRSLQSNVEELSGEKTKLEMNVLCLKEITDELTKGKLTLLEEIARLSDQKKDKQELLNSEFARLRSSNEELQNKVEKVGKENSELITQISSLKVTLATVQSAYEQTQDEIGNHKKRLEESIRREKQISQERKNLEEKSRKIEVNMKYFVDKNQSITAENKELSSSLNETRKLLESLEKDYRTIKGENSILSERIRKQESGANGEDLDSGKSSTQSLRKKLREFRAKLGEEKKQRELHEFEIKNLKEKVERLANKEKEGEIQLENNRKMLLEVKTERDGLLVDIESLNKRKKKDMEGYTSRIETLEDELRYGIGFRNDRVHVLYRITGS